MRLIIADNIIKDKIYRDIELSQYEKDNHTIALFREAVDFKIPRVGEFILWYNKKKLVVEAVMYDYKKIIHSEDDVVYVFGRLK